MLSEEMQVIAYLNGIGYKGSFFEVIRESKTIKKKLGHKDLLSACKNYLKAIE